MSMPTKLAGMEDPMHIAGIFEPGIDLRRKKNFEVVWGPINTHHFTGGRIYMSVVSREPAGALSLVAELQVIGYNANIIDVLKTGAANSASGPLVFDLHGYRNSFQSLGVQARQVLNGAADDTLVPELSLTVSGRLFR